MAGAIVVPCLLVAAIFDNKLTIYHKHLPCNQTTNSGLYDQQNLLFRIVALATTPKQTGHWSVLCDAYIG